MRVLIPWRDSGCPHRLAAFNHVRNYYPDPIVAELPSDVPWSKGAAIASVRTDADVLAIVDADCLAPDLQASIDAVNEGVPWAMPHTLVRRLDHDSTVRVFDGMDPLAGRCERRAYPGIESGGALVVRRDVYEESGGFDPGFEGWGGEDLSLGRVLLRLFGPPVRSKADLFHLYHPLAHTNGQMSESNRKLRRRWNQATRNEQSCRALIAERRATWETQAA